VEYSPLAPDTRFAVVPHISEDDPFAAVRSAGQQSLVLVVAVVAIVAAAGDSRKDAGQS
jgi:hypothetical protein